jgi:hypothetical protein
VASWNCRSLNISKTTPLLDFLNRRGAHVCGLSEIWDPQLECTVALGAGGFDFFPSKRTTGRGGGVALVTRSALVVVQVLPRPSVPPEVDVIAAELTVPGLPPMRVCVVYVPPEIAGGAAAFKEVLCKIDAEVRPDVILGDMNARHPLWCPEPRTAISDHKTCHRRGDVVVEFVASRALLVVNPVPAQATMPVSGTTPDVILATDVLLTARGSVGEDIGSDHLPVVLTLGDITAPGLQVPRRKVIMTAWGKVTAEHEAAFELSLIHALHTEQSKGSVDVRHARFVTALCEAMKSFPRGPCRPPVVRASAALEGLRVQMELLHAAGGPAYSAALTAYHDAARQEHEERWRDLASDGDPWRLRRKAQEVPAPNTAVSHEGTRWTSAKARANGFARLYCHKMRARLPTLPWVCPDVVPPPGDITLAELQAALRGHPLRSAIDPDGLSAEVLRLLPPCALEFLRLLLQDSLRQGRVPKRWCYSMVFPLLKPGKDPKLATSYRPVAVTSLLCRTLERIILKRIEATLQAKLAGGQFGFRRGYMMDMILAHLISDVTESWEEFTHDKVAGKQKMWQHRTVVFAVDVSDAFCSFSPTECINRLVALGVELYVARWIASFLSGRSFRVFIRGVHGRELDSEWGGPQGGVLTPALWLVFADDLVLMLHKKVKEAENQRPIKAAFGLAADDLTIWIRGACAGDKGVKFATDAAKMLLGAVGRWAAANGLDISDKSAAQMFSPSPHAQQDIDSDPRWDLKLAGHSMKPRADGTLKLLGLVLDPALTFTAHINHVLEECAVQVENLKWLARWLRAPQLLQVIHATLLSRMRYGIHLYWHQSCESMHHKLEVVLVSAVGLALGAISTSRKAPVLAEGHLRPLWVQVAKVTARRCMSVWMLPHDNPARVALLRPPPPEKSRGTARTTFKSQFARPPRELIPQLFSLPYKPEETATAGCTSFLLLPKGVTAKDPKVKRCAAMTARLSALPPAIWESWSDGSVYEKVPRVWVSGSAVLLYDAEGDVVDVIQCAHGPEACSFSAELWGQVNAVEAMERRVLAAAPYVSRPLVRLISDSLSSLAMLEVGPILQWHHLGARIWATLLRMGVYCDISLVFVFGHCDLVRGDKIDTAAKAAALLGVSGELFWVDAARAVYRPVNQLYDKDMKDSGDMGFRGTFKVEPTQPPKSLCRRDGRLLTQLRVGVCRRLGGWLFGVVDKCPRCGAPLVRGDGAAVSHLFECPAAVALRLQHSVLHAAPICLWEDHVHALRYAKAFLDVEEGPVDASQASVGGVGGAVGTQ